MILLRKLMEWVDIGTRWIVIPGYIHETMKAVPEHGNPCHDTPTKVYRLEAYHNELRDLACLISNRSGFI